jgi:hypothetical protein
MPMLAHAALAMPWHNPCSGTNVIQVYQHCFARLCEGIER